MRRASAVCLDSCVDAGNSLRRLFCANCGVASVPGRSSSIRIIPVYTRGKRRRLNRRIQRSSGQRVGVRATSEVVATCLGCGLKACTGDAASLKPQPNAPRNERKKRRRLAVARDVTIRCEPDATTILGSVDAAATTIQLETDTRNETVDVASVMDGSAFFIGESCMVNAPQPKFSAAKRKKQKSGTSDTSISQGADKADTTASRGSGSRSAPKNAEPVLTTLTDRRGKRKKSKAKRKEKSGSTSEDPLAWLMQG